MLYTGDLSRQDEGGYLYFVAGREDIIKSRGEKVRPRAIENVLCQMDGIGEAAAVGVEDEVLGQEAVVVVVLRKGGAGGRGARNQRILLEEA